MQKLSVVNWLSWISSFKFGTLQNSRTQTCILQGCGMQEMSDLFWNNRHFKVSINAWCFLNALKQLKDRLKTAETYDRSDSESARWKFNEEFTNITHKRIDRLTERNVCLKTDQQMEVHSYWRSQQSNFKDN